VIVVTSSEFIREFKSLDNAEALLVAKTLVKLEDSPVPIGKMTRGKLAGCYTIRCGQGGRLRLIYRHQVQTAKLITIGARQAGTVYLQAALIIGKEKR